MLNIDGKKISIFGFGLLVLITFLSNVLRLYGLYVLSSLGFLDAYLRWGFLAAYLLIAGGFGLRWLNDGESIDFLTACAFGATAALNFINLFTGILYRSALIAIPVQLIRNAFYFVMAIRAVKKNNTAYSRIMAVLCICGGLYSFILGGLVFGILGRLMGFPFWILVIENLGCVFCPVICMAECIMETD